MKKSLILLAVLMLVGCAGDKIPADNDIKEDLYIEPVNDIEVFEYLEQDTYDYLYHSNGDQEVSTYLLEYLGKDLVDHTLTDISGNSIDTDDLKDEKLIIEIAGNWCSHCKDQALKYTDELLKKYPEIVFIQFFNEGNSDEIKAFYAEISHPLPDNVIIIPEDAAFSNKLLSNYNPKFYPGFLFFNNGKLSWVKISQLTVEEMSLAYDVAFNDNLDAKDLVDANGASIFSHKRSKEDVKNDLSKDNYALLESLDSDGRSIDNTLSFMGKDFGFRSQYENDSSFESEADFMDYEDKDLVVIYYDEADESAEMINQFYKENKDISVIVLNVTDRNNEEMAQAIDAPVVSIMNQVPKMLNEVVFDSYPSALYIQKGTITGAFSDIRDIDAFNKSVAIFLKETSIALVSNN